MCKIANPNFSKVDFSKRLNSSNLTITDERTVVPLDWVEILLPRIKGWLSSITPSCDGAQIPRVPERTLNTFNLVIYLVNIVRRDLRRPGFRDRNSGNWHIIHT